MWRYARIGGVCSLVVVAGAWALFQPRSGVADPLFTRDRLVAEEAVFVEYSGAGAGLVGSSFELVHFRDGRWVLRQEGVHATEVIYDGARYMFRVAEGCYAVSGDQPRLPLIPGVTVSESLKDLPEKDIDGTTVSYELVPQPDATLKVTEDLSGLGASRGYAATTGGTALGVLRGDYTIRGATPAEIDGAEDLLFTRASALGNIILRSRLLEVGAENQVGPPSEKTILKDCPGAPVYPPVARPPVISGFLSGDTTMLVEEEGGELFLRDARMVGTDIEADAAELLAAADATEPTLAPLQAGSVYAFPAREGQATRGYLLIQILACGPNDVVRC